MRNLGVLLTILAAAAAYGEWGEVVSSFPAPGSQAGGLTFDGTYLWYADYARDFSTIYKLTTTGSFQGQWRVNWGYACGLAWDGSYLWSDALTARYVYKLNPANCSVINSFYGPSGHMMGMGCDGNYLYINDWQDRRIARVTFTGSLRQLMSVLPPSPSGVAIQGNYLWYSTRDFYTPANAKCIKAHKSNGSAVASFQSPDSQATDVGIQGNYLWVSGFTNKTIYKVDVTPPSAVVPTSLGKVKTLFR